MKKKIIPRNVRAILSNVLEEAKRVLGNDISKRKAYKTYFEKTGTIFIHIPKCAGTSVAETLYGVDPWHHSIKSYSECQLKKSEVFTIVRDPVKRFLSIYVYLKSKAGEYPDSIYTDALEAESIDDFFFKEVKNKSDEERNYFLRSQHWYISDNKGNSRVDHIVNMENLEMEFPEKIKIMCGFSGEFPKKNQSNIKDKVELSDNLKNEIVESYKQDYKYIVNYDNN
jgi:hypothetical protein